MLRTGMLALSVGLGLAAILPVGADVSRFGLAGLAPPVCLLFLWPLLRSHPLLRSALVAAALLCVGVGITLWRGHLYHQDLLPRSWEGHDFWVRGVVAGLPRSDGRRIRFLFHVQQSCLTLLPEQCPSESGGFAPRRILLSLYAQEPAVRPGQQWWFRVRLRRPGGTVNPGVMDQQARWFREGVSAVGYVRETAFNQRLAPGRPVLARLRHALSERLRLPDGRLSVQGLVHALVVGDQSGITDEQWQLFADTGTSHLVVISGLHVGFVAWTVFLLVGALLKRVPVTPSRWPSTRLAGICAIFAAAGYAALAGFSLPTRRALIMLVVVLAGRMAGRHHPPTLGFSVALVSVLLLDPLAVLSAGFWYSFTAVGVLLLGFGFRGPSSPRDVSGVEKLWERWGRSQWVVFVGLLVPMMVWQGSISLVSPLANILAIPVVSLVIVPLCLVAAVMSLVSQTAASLMLLLPAWCLAWLERLLIVLRDLAGELAVVSLPSLSWPATVCIVLATVLLLLPAGWPPRRLVLPLMGPLLLSRQDLFESDTVRLLVADVGQGLAVIIQTRHHTVVYDTGPGEGLLSRILLHELRAAGHERVHSVIISHAHADHVSGLDRLDQQFRVDRLWVGAGRGVDHAGSCRAGQSWRLDGVRFRMLHPGPADRHPRRDRNNGSCVLLIQAGGEGILLPGDIEAEAESALVERLSQSLQADILLMPHHGSGSSSTGGFIDAVDPSLALFSSGRGNRFGHPADEVLSRYQERGTGILGTPGSGAIRLCLGAGCSGGPVERQYRAGRPRFWR
ncbi:MAG: DNA internalization-related competence protein ComEC/Rec2 [Pseudomonadota bacterium]